MVRSQGCGANGSSRARRSARGSAPRWRRAHGRDAARDRHRRWRRRQHRQRHRAGAEDGTVRQQHAIAAMLQGIGGSLRRVRMLGCAVMVVAGAGHAVHRGGHRQHPRDRRHRDDEGHGQQGKPSPASMHAVPPRPNHFIAPKYGRAPDRRAKSRERKLTPPHAGSVPEQLRFPCGAVPHAERRAARPALRRQPLRRYLAAFPAGVAGALAAGVP